METKHFKQRQSRTNFVKNNIGIGYPMNKFYWDKGHPNGAEIHTVTNTGIIIVENARTHKKVTMLIARPQQIKRYYQVNNIKVPQGLIQIAFEHEQKGYNNL